MLRLTQLVPPSPKLRRRLLIRGISLLILGFFSFYQASRHNWDYVTTDERPMRVDVPIMVSNFGFGDSYVYDPGFLIIEMQSGDYLTIKELPSLTVICPSIECTSAQSVYIILLENTPTNTTMLSYQSGSIQYTNLRPSKSVYAYLAIPFYQNLTTGTELFVTMNLNHHETPNWLWFGLGVVLSSVALIPIFKSKRVASRKQAGLVLSAEGFQEAHQRNVM